MNTERQRSSLFCSQDVTRCVQVTPRQELHKFSMPHPHTHTHTHTNICTLLKKTGEIIQGKIFYLTSYL